MLRDRVDLHPLLQVVRDGDDLGVVALHIHLLDFSLAERSHGLAQEVLEQNSILLQVTGCQETAVHYNVVCFVMIAEQFHQVLPDVLFVLLLFVPCFPLFVEGVELLQIVDKHVVEVLYDDFVIAPIVNQVFLAVLYDFNQLIVLFLISTQGKVEGVVLEELEDEGSVEAVSVSPESPYVEVASPSFFLWLRHCFETRFKLRTFILSCEDFDTENVSHKGHVSLDLLLDVVLELVVEADLLPETVEFLLRLGLLG